ncbi:hypothetical protein ACJIZ3_018447 [Penstemon smallii]|uniref:Protein kish n=1 Tax=Penstemon smallii TaxID=265156 RepID=A0ABD3SZ93_9LAMI
MSALFNFHSFLTVVLLGICACTYVKMQFPALLEQRTGFRGVFWKAARIVLLFVTLACSSLLPILPPSEVDSSSRKLFSYCNLHTGNFSLSFHLLPSHDRVNNTAFYAAAFSSLLSRT